MTLASRLGRLTPTLTVKERVKLIIRAEREGREAEASLKAVAAEQIREYNHYIGLHMIANGILGWTVEFLQKQVDVLDERLQFPRILEEASDMVAEELGEAPDRKNIRAWRKRKTVSTTDFLYGLSVEGVDDVRETAVLRWQEMRCVEIVWEELAEVFDGEDIVLPDVRQRLESAKERVVAIIEPGKKRAVQEPLEEHIDEYRKVVEDVMKHFGLLEWR